MDKEDLISQITVAINNAIINGTPEYTNVKFSNSYFGSHKDIRNIGKKVLYNFNIINNDIDKMETDDYFIFKYMNLYIIINFYYNIDAWGLVDYKLLIVKSRDEALRYRYG